MSAANRRTWIVRHLLLWTTAQRSPRVSVSPNEQLAKAYTLHGFPPEHLAGDLRKLHESEILTRSVTSRNHVYWLSNVREAARSVA
jgi:hypothetical protein